MGIMGTYQRLAILDCTSGIQLRTYDNHAEMLRDLLESCEPSELLRIRVEVIPEIEEEKVRFEAEGDVLDNEFEEEDD